MQRDQGMLRDWLEELEQIDRPSASEGERRAAEWIVKRLHGDFVEATFGGAEACHPFPLQLRAMVLEQDIGADDGGLHEAGRSAVRPVARTASWRSADAGPAHWHWP